jgi:hypothetical protein
MQWPLEDGKQAAKLDLAVSLDYTSVLAVEKVYSAPVADEALDLPMASAKFLLIQAESEDLDIKLNGAANAITVKAGTGFLFIYNPDGAITGVTVTAATAPATLKGYVFA